MEHLGGIIPKGLLISRNCDGKEFDWMPSLYKHPSFNETKMELIDRWQELKIHRQRYAEENEEEEDPSIWCIVDDMSDDSSVMNSRSFKRLFSYGRTHKITTLVTGTYFTDLKPMIRDSLDYAFFCANKSICDRRAIYKLYADSSQMRFKDFCDIYDRYTANYGVLVVSTVHAEGNVFSYMPRRSEQEFKAKFTVGTQEFRDYSQRHYRNVKEEQMLAKVRAKMAKRRRKNQQAETESEWKFVSLLADDLLVHKGKDVDDDVIDPIVYYANWHKSPKSKTTNNHEWIWVSKQDDVLFRE